MGPVKGVNNEGKTYALRRTLSPQPFNLSIAIHLVVFEYSQLGLLALVLDLLGCGVDLLLSLFSHTSPQPEDKV